MGYVELHSSGNDMANDAPNELTMQSWIDVYDTMATTLI